MAIETTTQTYSEGTPHGFQTLLIDNTVGDFIELDGPDAWALYQRLESFIKDPKTKFPEAIFAFEFDEGYADESHRTEAWEPILLSPCCGSYVEGIYSDQEIIELDLSDVHDGGHVSLDSSDSDGGTLLYVCGKCELGVSIPSELTLEW
jgi:hypothetical protein